MTGPATILAVDPGEVHVGIARFTATIDATPKWSCTRTGEFDQPGFYRYLANALWGGLDLVIYETWQIYADMAPILVGSKCETAECIGVIKYLVSSYPATAWVEQPASIQIPTTSLLRSKSMKSRAKADGTGEHALSAELHGWCYLFQQGWVS